ncbi:MAG TPA: DUF6314 family protein [Solirubrobacterales bacterium]|nr:DUF6314 family protein [Solirubrobacterales bacterium]
MPESAPSNWMQVDDPVETLAGDWTFERTVTDSLSGTTGAASGIARFERSGDGLDWDETGTLRFGGHDFDAKRRMSIAREDGEWQVRFDDGRPFHPLDLNRGRCEVGHPCRDDFYSGTIEMLSTGDGPELRTEWRVRGPKKDQLIRTRYRRV